MTHRSFPSKDSGLSLIELVVAMALFAVVAVMGLQSLTGTMRVSERLTQIDAETAELGNTIALLRNDLNAIVPMLFYPPQSAPDRAVHLSENGTTLGLSIAGQKALTATHTDKHRAQWSVDDSQSTLTRQFWPALNPADQSQLSLKMLVLNGVTGLSVRTYWPSVGWTVGATPPLTTQISATPDTPDQDVIGAPPPVYFSILPIAVEVTLQTTKHGDLRLVQTLQ